jgi:hypothetical protein
MRLRPLKSACLDMFIGWLWSLNEIYSFREALQKDQEGISKVKFYHAQLKL